MNDEEFRAEMCGLCAGGWSVRVDRKVPQSEMRHGR